MTLVWHDWFATSNDGVGQQSLMLAQNELFRRNALGSFDQLAHDVTQDPAMIVWLNLTENARWNPNENYARELMELFTLGADRGAYTESDVRELARALTGLRLRLERRARHARLPLRARSGTTTGARRSSARPAPAPGSRAWRCACATRMHPSFFVEQAVELLHPHAAVGRATARALESLYVSSGYQVRPVLEAILLHPDLYAGPRW